MIIGESIIQWHSIDHKPKEDWADVLIACKDSTGNLDVFFAHWSSQSNTFEGDNYPFLFEDVVYWAYMPKVNSLLVS